MCEVNKLQTNNMCAFHNDIMLVLNKDLGGGEGQLSKLVKKILALLAFQ